MRKSFLFLFVIILLSGCGDKTNDNALPGDSTEVVTVKDNNPPALVDLKYIFKKGEKFRYRITSYSQAAQTIKSDTTISGKVNEKYIYIVEFEAVDIDETGSTDLKTTFASINAEFNAPGQTMKYKSGEKLDSVEAMNFVQYESILNNPFNIRISQKGEILEVYKADRIMNKFIELQKIERELSADEKAQLRSMIVDGAIKPLLQQTFRIIPKKEIGADSTWTETKHSQLGTFNVTNIVDYKLDSFEKLGEDKIASYSGVLKIIAEGQTKHKEGNVEISISKPKATGSGKVLFNITKGRIQKSENKTKLEMTSTMKAPQMGKGPSSVSKFEVIENSNLIELLK